jgi:sugar/nucleoside kinase (ribokinase family)
VDLSPIQSASWVYVDCYQLIEGQAFRAIEAAQAAEVPLLVNLGGSPLSPNVAALLWGGANVILQTNVDDVDHRKAPQVAEALLRETEAAWAVITCGAYGAVALSPSEQVSAPGFKATVRHTHCAGAAFSGGLLYGLREGWPMLDCLSVACASGALRCERPHDQAMPTLDELREVIDFRACTELPTP